MTYKFEITMTEQDVEGDEFWENAIDEDPTGIKPLTEALIQVIDESNLIIGRDVKDCVKLVSCS